MLLKLNSIKHNIHLIKCVDNKVWNDEWGQFAKQIGELRKNWFYLHKEQQIEKTWETTSSGIIVLLEIINALALISEKIFTISFSSKKHLGSYYILPNSLQIIKFDLIEKSRIITYTNPFSFLRKIPGIFKHRITKNVNDFSIITIPWQLMLLFLPSISGIFAGEKRLKGNLIVRDKEVPFQWGQESGSELIRLRFKFFAEYNEFVRNNGLFSMSILSLVPWLTNIKAKFYDFKKAIIKGMLKLRLV